MHPLPHSVPLMLQQAIANPCLCQRLLDTHGQVWVSLLWGHCSFLLSPDVHKVVCALQESVSQSCVSSGSSMVGLIVTSFKRAYAISRSAAPRVPIPELGHSWPIPLQEILRHNSGSVFVGSLGPGVHKVCLNPWASVEGMGFDSKHDFTPPTVFLGLLICPWTWGIFLVGSNISPVNHCIAASCNFGVLAGEDEHMSFYSAILRIPH